MLQGSGGRLLTAAQESELTVHVKELLHLHTELTDCLVHAQLVNCL